MDIILFLILLCAIALIGFIQINQKLRLQHTKRNFAVEYHNKIGAYLNSGCSDNDIYTWLIHRSTKMQSQLGAMGIIFYREAFGLYVTRNYLVILNSVPKLRQEFDVHPHSQILKDTLDRYIGLQDDKIDELKKVRANPFIWFREGIDFLVITPLKILNWLEVIRKPLFDQITSSPLYKVFVGLVSIAVGTLPILKLFGFNIF